MSMNLNAVSEAQAVGWRRVYFNSFTIAFWGVHLLAIAGIAYLGFSLRGLALCMALYLPRMFFVTGAYHRYFSHRAYKTSRWFQFVLAVGAQLTAQKGVLWWAAHHRIHHKLSDEHGDLHSVKQSGFWWAHMGWILSRDLEGTDLSRIKDFSKYPELRWLNTYWMIPALVAAVATFAIGQAMYGGDAGLFALVWGFALCQVLTWHGTFTINSLSHLWGGRRYATSDDSRNNPVLALVTLGEGWHNNHHHYQVSARNGFYWWEIDITYYVLRAFAAVGLVWDLHPVPRHIRDRVPPPAEAAGAAEAAAADDDVAGVPDMA